MGFGLLCSSEADLKLGWEAWPFDLNKPSRQLQESSVLLAGLQKGALLTYLFGFDRLWVVLGFKTSMSHYLANSRKPLLMDFFWGAEGV